MVQLVQLLPQMIEKSDLKELPLTMDSILGRSLRLGFLVSHRGTNMQAIIDACRDGRLRAIPAIAISNNSDCQALLRAKQQHIPAYTINIKTHSEPDDAILQLFRENDVDLVVLAGYMKKIGVRLIKSYTGKIINIHPSLLPKYGGQGMYGSRVHEAVLAAGEKKTGVTVHLVDEEYDQGSILTQQSVPVEEDDTTEILAARVLATEHELLVETLRKILNGDIPALSIAQGVSNSN